MDFIQNNLYNHGQLPQFLSTASCTLFPTQYTWDVGSFMEGVSVLANVTGNATLVGMCVVHRHYVANSSVQRGKELTMCALDRLHGLVATTTTNTAFNTMGGRISECKRARSFFKTQL